ncbi:MAG: hypothetical protein KDA84_29905 [Planctomycetaceae bacterium]|nr:hypothetical protein [Planctomycetaceae bacterium]
MSFWLVLCLIFLGVVLEIVIVERIMARWPQHGQWGINPNPVDCPHCGMRQPKARFPKTIHQALWGGWTCRKCGSEMDKYGHLKKEGDSSVDS